MFAISFNPSGVLHPTLDEFTWTSVHTWGWYTFLFTLGQGVTRYRPVVLCGLYLSLVHYGTVCDPSQHRINEFVIRCLFRACTFLPETFFEADQFRITANILLRTI